MGDPVNLVGDEIRQQLGAALVSVVADVQELRSKTEVADATLRGQYKKIADRNRELRAETRRARKAVEDARTLLTSDAEVRAKAVESVQSDVTAETGKWREILGELKRTLMSRSEFHDAVRKNVLGDPVLSELHLSDICGRLDNADGRLNLLNDRLTTLATLEAIQKIEERVEALEARSLGSRLGALRSNTRRMVSHACQVWARRVPPAPYPLLDSNDEADENVAS